MRTYVEAEEMIAGRIEDEGAAERDNSRWAIDIAWLEERGRAFAAMAEHCLCTKCRKRRKSEPEPVATDGLFGAAKECSAHSGDYITGGLPILESIFRLFLAEGNKPLDLIELGRRLSERRGVDTYRTSVEMLSRLLRDDRHYGIRRVEA